MTNFNITAGSNVATINLPNTISWGESRDLTMFDLWAGSHVVWDKGIDTHNFKISGTHYGTGTSSPTYVFAKLDIIVEAGSQVTLSLFKDTWLDTTWYVEEYSYTSIVGVPNVVEWSISFEKAY